MGNFVLPPKSQVGYLDPEIAGEGQMVLMSDGENVPWAPPPVNPVIPDLSNIKSIKKYFRPYQFRAWPAWIYHPDQPPRLVKNADEAAELGICYREPTAHEKERFGDKKVWDWKDECEWRPFPFPKDLKFDPLKPGPGKEFQKGPVNPVAAEEAMILKVAAAVGAALKLAGPGAPATVNPKQWDEFLAFQAWQKAQEVVKAEAVNALVPEIEQPEDPTESTAEDAELVAWRAEAEDKGIKVDKRWGLARLKMEVENAA